MIRSTEGGESSPDLAVLTDEIVERIRQGEPVDVERLVERHPQHADALRDLLPMMHLLTDLSQPAGDSAGEGEALLPREIGDFRIVRELGRGGMGVVYEARQLSLNRRAALKVLPFAAMFEEKQLARFKNEAQAAASLDHENIVHAYAVGCDRGVHYFAMQYIEGQNLAEAIAELRQARGGQPPADTPGEAESPPMTGTSAGLASPKAEDAASGAESDLGKGSTDCLGLGSTAGDRSGREYFKTIARLMAKAADALDYAHQRGVVHRDVKPSNLLLDTNQKIYVADFGLASIEGDRNLTSVGGVLGTARYMSPEQAAGDTRRVDHRTDIYSLGATLYELAALRPAFGGASHAELLRRIESEEPPALRKLNRRIPRDLETIVGKAMAKEPAERYATAADLTEDLRRFAEDCPILAKPLSATRRIMRWSQQRAGTLIAATVVMMLATIGSTTAAGLIWHEHEQADIARTKAVASAAASRAAETREREQRIKAQAAETKEHEQRLRAERSEKEAQATLEFMISAFRSLDPVHQGYKVTVPQVLDRAAKRLRDDDSFDPPSRAAILHVLGESYSSAEIGDEAVALLAEALELRRAHYGPKHPDTLESMKSLAGAFVTAGNNKKAIDLAENTLKVSRDVLGENHSTTLGTMNNLGAAYLADGDYSEAIKLFTKTLGARREKLGADHSATLMVMNNLATAYKDAGRLREAISLYEEVAKVQREKLGPRDLDTLVSMGNLGTAYEQAGQVSKAIEILEEVYRIFQVKYGRDHPFTLTSMNNLAGAYRSAGQDEKALALYKTALDICKATLAPGHPDLLGAMVNLACYYMSIRRFADAQDLLDESVKVGREKLSSDHPVTLLAMANLATLYLHRGQLDEGISLMEETVRLQRATLGPDHPNTLQTMNNLANAYGRSGNLERATSLVEETLRRRIALLGESHPDTLFAKASLGACYRDAGRLDKAIPLLEEAYFKRGRIARLQKVSGSLLEAYILAGAKEKALALMETRVKAMRAATPAGSTRLAGNLAINVLNLLRLEAWEQAEPVVRECLAIREKEMPDSWLTFNSKSQLGAALLGQGKLKEAEPLLLEAYNGMREREEEIPAAGKVRLQEALLRLVELYEAWDKPAEADRWRGILEGAKPADPPAPTAPTTEARGQAVEPGEAPGEGEPAGAVQQKDRGISSPPVDDCDRRVCR